MAIISKNTPVDYERKPSNQESTEAWSKLQKYKQRDLLCDLFDLSHVATNDEIVTTIKDWLK